MSKKGLRPGADATDLATLAVVVVDAAAAPCFVEKNWALDISSVFKFGCGKCVATHAAVTREFERWKKREQQESEQHQRQRHGFHEQIRSATHRSAQ